MTYNRGDIVVVKFPFVTREKETQKGRSALVIAIQTKKGVWIYSN